MLGKCSRTLAFFAGGLALVVMTPAMVQSALAGDFPTRTVTLIVPFPPGGTMDIEARLIAKGLASRFGKSVVVDNRPGAGGRVGTDAAARAAPDGHTLLMGSISPLAIEPVLHANTSYDPQRDFAPLTLATEMPFVLLVAPNIPAKSLSELIQYGRKSDQLTYATWGVGTSSHLVAEVFKNVTGTHMVHVPYKGGPAAVLDMISGRVSVMFGLAVDMAPHVKAGKLRALAVTRPRRLPILPEVPTFSEAGVSDVDLRAWFGFLVPAKTPPEIRSRLHEELVALLKSSEFTQWADSQGVSVIASSPEVLTERIRSDSALASKLAKSISLKLND